MDSVVKGLGKEDLSPFFFLLWSFTLFLIPRSFARTANEFHH